MNWYYFKNKQVQGYCTGQNKQEAKELIEKFTGYPISQLKIQRVKWNGEEFEKYGK